MPENHPIQILGKILGRNYLLIQNAIKGRKLDLNLYTIEVVGEEEYPALVFTEEATATSAGGTFAVRPGSDASLSDREIAVLNARPDRKVQDVIHTSSLPFIQKALTVFPHVAELGDHYKIQIVKEGETVAVQFLDKDRPASARGSGGAHAAYEVIMNLADLTILRSNYVR